jgi:peroxiredoxin
MKNITICICVILFCFLSVFARGQNTVNGRFPQLANLQIRLEGYDGFNTYHIAETKISSEGGFDMKYSEADYGMGYLVTEDNNSFVLVLSGEDIELTGESLAHSESIDILRGDDNLVFERYAKEHPRREQTLSAWIYLRNIYKADPLFRSQDKPRLAVETEIERIRQEDKGFLNNLPPGSFISWYLPMRKLISSVPVVAQYRTEEIPGTIDAFRHLDYIDPKLYKSGLLWEAIEAHFWLIENSGRPLDSVFIEMNISIDHLIDNIVSDTKKFNEITEYLFKLLEQRSLFGSSEYLALKVLNEVSCTIDNDLSSQLESYRLMKIGNIAPDFEFTNGLHSPAWQPGRSPGRLSEIESKYNLVVFGAGWCPICSQSLKEIAGLYEKWKSYGVEVVYVSLDEDEQVFKNNAGAFPFISVCDYKKWESPVVKSYHVFATPTLFLLNEKRGIILRPNSVQHVNAWVEWNLAKQ